ncbi:MAG: hypothetical protein SW127_09970 [Actinomycetota bacterium]|nr:hypothetical protein [Actinomycetota bacterium]
MSGPLEIEQVIDRHRRALDRIVRVVGTLWTREFHLADGQLIKFRVLMEVTNWRCVDCSVDIREIDEFYAVHDDLWLAAAQGDRGGQLCVGCLEVRLGRELTRADFKNKRASLDGRYSERLRERENRTRET